jgi:hypothetical protein
MSKRKRPSRRDDDAIHNLQDWQDHQYDPGYRANLGRLGLFSGSRRGRPVGRFIAYAIAAECALLLLLSFVERIGVRGAWLGLGFLCASAAVLIFIMSKLIRVPGRPKRNSRARH